MDYKTLISPADLHTHLDDPAWVIVDCRFWLDDTQKGRRDFQNSHIPRAIYAHLDEDLSGPVVAGETGRHPLPPVDIFAQRLGSWGIDKDVQVVVYDDRGGAVAARLWWMLKWMGHGAAAVLDGGWPAWLRADYPTTDELPAAQKREFEPNLRSELVVTAADLLAHFGDPSYRLIDSRAPERYTGEQEPIDAVGGHISGALSYPFQRNLDVEENFIPKEFLKGRFHVLLEGTPAVKTIFYCGSGVTAAQNILAVTHTGLGMPRLYAGSWSDWITDPERPITTGE
jgi:thiosulfate/3-mercaptopyruvate sulfurtransferase